MAGASGVGEDDNGEEKEQHAVHEPHSPEHVLVAQHRAHARPTHGDFCFAPTAGAEHVLGLAVELGSPAAILL